MAEGAGRAGGAPTTEEKAGRGAGGALQVSRLPHQALTPVSQAALPRAVWGGYSDAGRPWPQARLFSSSEAAFLPLRGPPGCQRTFQRPSSAPLNLASSSRGSDRLKIAAGLPDLKLLS